MQYREPLPQDCPPPSAQDITEQTVRYRLLKGMIPTQRDFDSYVKINGNPKLASPSDAVRTERTFPVRVVGGRAGPHEWQIEPKPPVAKHWRTDHSRQSGQA